MKLAEMKISEYLDVLGSDAAAPGGGAVCALAGSQGIGLVMMVADLTIGKERYAAYRDTCVKVREKATRIYPEMMAAMDRDADVFSDVAEAYKMPSDTDEERKARSAAIADATLAATEVPFRLMELGAEGIFLTTELIGNSNPNVVSDLGIALLQLCDCIRGSWMNVRINLPSIADKERAEFFRKEGERIYKEAGKMADRYFDEILAEF